MNEFRGHDYDIRHFRTPRTCPGFYVERNTGDKVVMIVVCVIGWMLLAGIMAGVV